MDNYIKILHLISELNAEPLTVRQSVLLHMIFESVVEYHDAQNDTSNDVEALKGRETKL